MGILERISNILRANINANLERSTNPEIALNQMLGEMEVAIQEARTHLLELQNIERQLEAEKTKYLREAREWGSRAERAVAVYREDAARDALQRRAHAENAAAEYHKQWEDHHIVVVQFQDQLKNLLQRYQDTKRNRALLLTRQRAALTQQRMQQVLQNTQHLDPQGPTGQLSREVRRLEAEAQAQAEVNRIPRTLEEELAQLDAETNANQHLNSLRQRYHEPPVSGWSNQTGTLPAGAPVPQLPAQPRARELWFENTSPPVPQPPKLWFDDEPNQATTPPAPKQLWFDDTPTQANATPPQPKQLWFNDEPSQATPPAPKQLWFDEPSPSTIAPQPPQLWFDDAPAQANVVSSKPKEPWFDDEPPAIGNTPTSQSPKEPWFDDALPSTQPPTQSQAQNYWFDDAPPTEPSTSWPTPPGSTERNLHTNETSGEAATAEKPLAPKKDYWFDD